jgi:hypothetical protein
MDEPYSGVTYAPEIPPSTRKVDAVTNEDSSDARKINAAATSAIERAVLAARWIL